MRKAVSLERAQRRLDNIAEIPEDSKNALSLRNIVMISSKWSKRIRVFKVLCQKEMKVIHPTSQGRFLLNS